MRESEYICDLIHGNKKASALGFHKDDMRDQGFKRLEKKSFLCLLGPGEDRAREFVFEGTLRVYESVVKPYKEIMGRRVYQDSSRSCMSEGVCWCRSEVFLDRAHRC